MQKYAIPKEWYPKISELAHACKMQLWASVFDIETAKNAVPYLDAIKIASSDVTNQPLVDAVAKLSKDFFMPMIISTGAAYTWEVYKATEHLWRDYTILPILMQCNSEYPAASEDAQLGLMRKMFYDNSTGNWGYSDHTMTSLCAQLAVAMGYTVFEKHCNPLGFVGNPDTEVSLSVSQFKQYVDDILLAAKICKHGTQERVLTNGEYEVRNQARRGYDGFRPGDK